MSRHDDDRHDRAPGDKRNTRRGLINYLVGLTLAGGLTVLSFAALGSTWIWGPGIPVVLVMLAIAQMGVHLVFFLHITTGPDNTNNVLALAFGVLIVFLVVAGSLWIMAHLNHNMMTIPEMMQRQR
jgi:cytochrome o ubiquinol oxidase subunit IV